jgi:glutamyl-tRNA synthetase
MTAVTRYAPSPTGALHIGGARTALFSWAFARHHGGRFLLRIEDTDVARSTRESEQAVLEAMEWLGLDHDPAPGENPIPRQSERLEIYRAAVERLIDGGKAYRCVCTPGELEEMRTRAREEGRKRTYEGVCRNRNLGSEPGRPFCVRLRTDEDGPTRWNDAIAGPSGEEAQHVDDFVIARTDGTPVYHLAVVVDDHEMGITHVIRGREHMSSTPRQLLLYDALGFDPPAFAHVPLLVEPGGKKLSKRHASVSVQEYRDRGFLPEVVLNYLARLGWGHGDVEVFTRQQFVEWFTLDGVGKSPSQVHEDKLLWLSQHYLKSVPPERLLDQLRPYLASVAGGPVTIDPGLEKLLDLLRARARTLVEMAELAGFYLRDEVELDPKAARKHLKPEAREPLGALMAELEKLPTWDEESLKQGFERVTERLDLKLGKLAQPVRVAVTGSSASPGIFETLELLGRERCLARIGGAIEYLEASSENGSAP